MKSRKHRTVNLQVRDAVRECAVQPELKSFLRALSSYPDRFARDPYLSFEQHLGRIAANQPATLDRHRD